MFYTIMLSLVFSLFYASMFSDTQTLVFRLLHFSLLYYIVSKTQNFLWDFLRSLEPQNSFLRLENVFRSRQNIIKTQHITVYVTGRYNKALRPRLKIIKQTNDHKAIDTPSSFYLIPILFIFWICPLIF